MSPIRNSTMSLHSVPLVLSRVWRQSLYKVLPVPLKQCEGAGQGRGVTGYRAGEPPGREATGSGPGPHHKRLAQPWERISTLSHRMESVAPEVH